MRPCSIAFALVLAMAPLVAQAGALGVSPVGFELPAAQHTAILTIRNDGDAPISVQTRAFRWSQPEGGDRLDPSPDVVVSPPITTLAAHGEQIVRLVRISNAPVLKEESYRLIVDQLPAPPSPGQVHVVTLLMRHSIPVFFEPDAPLLAATAWRLETTPKGAFLAVTNTGGRRQRIADLQLFDAGGHTVGEHKGLVGYILPGASVRWVAPISSTATTRPVRVKAATDVGAVDASLASSTP